MFTLAGWAAAAKATAAEATDPVIANAARAVTATILPIRMMPPKGTRRPAVPFNGFDRSTRHDFPARHATCRVFAGPLCC